MKKFTYLMAAFAMLSLNVNAQLIDAETYANPEFGGEVVELQNASFETGEILYKEDGTTVDMRAFDGWTVGNTSTVNWGTRSHSSMLSKIQGSWYARLIGGNNTVEQGSYIKQDFTGKGPGTYILSAITYVSRNSHRGFWTSEKGNYWDENAFAGLYIMDNEDFDGGTVESPGFKKILGFFNADNSTGEGPFTRQFVAYDAPYGEGMTIGFGITESCPALSKGQIQCDAFKVEYVPGKTVDEVNELIEAKTSGVQAIKTVADKNGGAIFNLAGQKVNDSFKGIAIQNGRKFIAK